MQASISLSSLTVGDRAVLEGVVKEILATSANSAGPAFETAHFIDRANAWLRANHGYSLKPNIPVGPGDVLVRWLKSRNTGHCELFAGSLVLLARTAGLPARVVTGFRGGAWNGYANNLTVRNSDAHAWAEIFDAASGSWIRADALGEPTSVEEKTASGEVVQRAARVERGWSARLESLRIFWYRRIVSFDQRTQMETLEAVKEVTENSGRDLREALGAAIAAVKRWFAGPWDARRFAVVLAWALAFLSTAWIWREYGASLWMRFVQALRGRRDDPVRIDAGRWLVRIAEEERTEDAPEVVAELQRLRFGARSTWPEPKRVFRSARHALRSPRRRRH
jgi:protein-glutamine gamma-glutamyltransferase